MDPDSRYFIVRAGSMFGPAPEFPTIPDCATCGGPVATLDGTLMVFTNDAVILVDDGYNGDEDHQVHHLFCHPVRAAVVADMGPRHL